MGTDANFVDAQCDMAVGDAAKRGQVFPVAEPGWNDRPAGGYDAVGAFGPGDHADGPQQEPGPDRP